MAWIRLFFAGATEVFWATMLKLSDGFSRHGYAALTVCGMIASYVLLAQAAKTLPLGTAYAVWTGIGALGALIAGVVLFREPVTAARLFFAALLLTGIAGLKFTGG